MFGVYTTHQNSPDKVDHKVSKNIKRDPNVSKTTKQLNRVRGQLEGVMRMIEQERSCVEVTQQLLAVRSSLTAATRSYLMANTISCAATEQDKAVLDRMMKGIFELE